jgi:hypothetical protein
MHPPRIRQPPAAHGGFSGRSVAVPISALYAHAAASNKRLVLCGHSLGGAVALLCTIKILRIWAAHRLGLKGAAAAAADRAAAAACGGKGGGGGRAKGRQGRKQRDNLHLAAAAAAAAAAPYADPNIRCITFAAPAVANESLAAEVVAAGWDRLISNFVQPGELFGMVGGWGRGCEREAAGRKMGRVAALSRLTQPIIIPPQQPPSTNQQNHQTAEDVVVPFVNKLLKAEEGSAALERSLRRLASSATLAPTAPGGPGAHLRSIVDSLVSSGRAKGLQGPLQDLKGILSIESLSRAASATASAAACVMGAGEDAGTLHSQLLEDSAYKQTAAIMSLAMASACHLPAAETLGNAPHAPEAAQRLRHCDGGNGTPRTPAGGGGGGAGGGSVVESLCEARRRGRRGRRGGGAGGGGNGGNGGGGGGGNGHGGHGMGLRPASDLQGGLPTEALVMAAEAGVIGLSEAELAELDATQAVRVGGAGWLTQSAVQRTAPPSIWLAAAAAAGADAAAAEAAGGAGGGGGGIGLQCSDEQLLLLRGRAVERRRGRGRARRARSASECTSEKAERRVAFADEMGGDPAVTAVITAAADAAAAAAARLKGGSRLQRSSGRVEAVPPAAAARGMRVSRSMTQLWAAAGTQGGGSGGSGGSSGTATPAPGWPWPAAAPAAKLTATEKEAAVEALLQRRGNKSLKERVFWSGARAAALATPHIVTGAAASLPAGAALSALLPASFTAAAAGPLAPFLFVATLVVGMILPALLALPPAAVLVEFIGSLIVTFAVPRTYTLGQQWVLTGQGLEPALKPLAQYHRDWTEFGTLGGIFPGHRMIAYRDRLIRLLPGQRLQRLPNSANLARAAAAAAAAAKASAGGK